MTGVGPVEAVAADQQVPVAAVDQAHQHAVAEGFTAGHQGEPAVFEAAQALALHPGVEFVVGDVETAHVVVEAGEVQVDGKVESRKRAKLRVGQRVRFAGEEIVLVSDEVGSED